MEKSAKLKKIDDRMVRAIETHNTADLAALLMEQPAALEMKLLPAVHNATPLILASALGAINSCKFLMEQGANRKATNRNGLNCMTIAALNNQVKSLQLFLDNGFDIDEQDQAKGTSLESAIIKDSVDATEFLLQKGAQRGPFYVQHSSPTLMLPILHFAVLQGASKVTQLLVEKYGYNVNEKSFYEPEDHTSVMLTPNDLAVMGAHYHIAQYLKEKGADATSHWNHLQFLIAKDMH